MEIRQIGDTVDMLGESCVWSVSEQALYWIDIRGPALRRFQPASGALRSFALPELVGALALRARGGVVLALSSGVAGFDVASGRIEPIAAAPAVCANQRFNDGRCDRQGRFWVGVMDDVDRGETGALCRLGSDHRLEVALSPMTIPNALAWSPDGRTMYLSDTTSRRIMAFDYDLDAGEPSRPRLFAEVESPGSPDGATVDAEGFLWNAEYGGGRLTRYAPDGRVDRRVALPVRRPTCCAFGGPDLATLFVTSAAQGMSPAEREDEPLAGAVLAMEPGARGVKEPGYFEG